jgi:hypothetical protein
VVGLVFGLLAALTAQAVPNAQVETVQAPAWIERAGKRLPVAAGMQLINRDRLLTGEGARVVVLFADGSAFKVGENSLLAVNAMQQAKNGLFSGGVDLKAGDLRLISHEYEEAPVKRSINVRFGEVTAAVRGEADITGTAEPDRDSVTLRDGSAVFTHPQGEAVEMDTPLQVYQAAKDQAPAQVWAVDRFQGASWALRTQPLYDAGTQQKIGKWSLRFGVFDKEEVLALFDQLRQAGYSAKILPVVVPGGHRYELRLNNLVTEREAISLGERLADNLQLPPADVLRR